MAQSSSRLPDAAAPLFQILLAGMVPLFGGVLLSDLAYSASYEPQWKNFASWLLVGALIFAGIALLWTLVNMLRVGRLDRRSMVNGLLLLGTWFVGFINALVHAKDAWASMPTALYLSLITAPLAFVAAWLGLTPHKERAP